MSSSFNWCAYLVNGGRVGAHDRERLDRRRMATLRSPHEGRYVILLGKGGRGTREQWETRVLKGGINLRGDLRGLGGVLS